jgi:hypothetical protein
MEKALTSIIGITFAQVKVTDEETHNIGSEPALLDLT